MQKSKCTTFDLTLKSVALYQKIGRQVMKEEYEDCEEDCDDWE